MKINEVEQLAGISKKNIRFYEEQGLIHPQRNLGNGYRLYTKEDVELLLKIKLLRRLAIPIEEIRKIQSGRLSLSECMERHQILLAHERSNLEHMEQMCKSLSDTDLDFSSLPAVRFLEELSLLEKGGNRCVNVHQVDVNRKKRTAIIAALITCLFMLAWEGLILVMNDMEPAPMILLVLLLGAPGFVVIGVLFALKERLKEIERGEDHDAAKY